MLNTVILAASLLVDGWGAASTFCTLRGTDVKESSGIAASHLTPNAYFTHNDSGDRARFFRFNNRGQVTGTYTLPTAKAVDWEDMASRLQQRRSYLYIGDIGDNSKKRPNVVVYRVQEPAGGSESISKIDTYTLTYPNGARDCEALIVDPATGDLYLVTKVGSGQSEVYFVAAPSKSGSFALTLLGKVTVDTGGLGGTMVTAGDASPDGKYVALRTYSGAVEFRVGARFRDWWKSSPNRVPVMAAFQSEAICYSRDSGRILTTSEGSPCPVATISREKTT